MKIESLIINDTVPESIRQFLANLDEENVLTCPFYEYTSNDRSCFVLNRYRKNLIPVMTGIEYLQAGKNKTKFPKAYYFDGFEKGYYGYLENLQVKEQFGEPYNDIAQYVFLRVFDLEHTGQFNVEDIENNYKISETGFGAGTYFAAWTWIIKNSLRFDKLLMQIFASPLLPALQTIWGTDKIKLEASHEVFTDSGLLKCDLDSWLYWFGGKPCSTPELITWIYRKGEKSALTFFVENISETHTIDYATARKIFDVKIYNRNKWKSEYKDIESLIKKIPLCEE